MQSAKQVASRFGVEHITVRRWVLRGLLPAHKIGGIWLFDPVDLDAFQKPHKGGGRPRKTEKI